jgi:putative peptidoglycan lipid II flippase
LPEPSVEAEITSGFGPRKGRTVGIVGVLTAFVAVVGYLREAALAGRFGISTTMDAYFAAIFIPNILYLVLIAGTLSPVFIPILMQENPDEDPGKASVTFSVITNFALLVLVLIVSCGVMGAHFWLPRLFPGFNPSTADLAVRLVYFIFPALPFLAVAGILTALLNGFHRFWLAAFAPAVSSIAVIGAALFLRGDRAIYGVGIATAVGFILQCAVLLPGAASLGVRYRPILNFRHPAIKKLLRLGVPLFLYLVVANASLVLERNLASRISAGAVSTLTYALRLFTVPSNFLAAPLAIVAYPGFAREAVRDQRGELAGQTSRLFRLLIFLFLPVTLWTILNATAITRVLYEHGKFSASDSWTTSRILAIYSIGIVPNAVAIVLLRCFYAIEDTVTPLLAELVDLGFFVTAAPLLTVRFGLAGLAAARSVTFFIVMTILTVVLARRGLLRFNGFPQFLLRTIVPTLVMGFTNWLSWRFLGPLFDAAGTLGRLTVICLVLALSTTVFLAFAMLLRLGEARQIMSTVSDLVPGRGRRGAK